MVTLADLLNPRTRTQWRTWLMSQLQSAGFAVSLAPSNDNRRNVVEMFAAGMAKADETIAKIAAGAFLETAVGEWLRLRVKSGHDVDAKPATLTVGVVRLACASTAGPYTIVAGQVWVGRAAAGAVPARRYQNTTGGTLASGGTLDVTVSAEAPGSAYNLGNGLVNQVFTGLPGVSVTNPPLGLTATWILTPGTDPEIDQPAALRQRARDKWGTLGRGANDAAYRYIATSAHPEVTRVRVAAVPGDGTLSLYLAGIAGGASTNAVAAVQAAVNLFSPLTDRPTARAATNVVIAVLGTVYVRAGQLAAVQAAVERERQAAQGALDLGETVDLALLNAILRRPRGVDGLVVPGVTDVDLTSPAGDTAISVTSVAVLNFDGITWTAVA